MGIFDLFWYDGYLKTIKTKTDKEIVQDMYYFCTNSEYLFNQKTCEDYFDQMVKTKYAKLHIPEQMKKLEAAKDMFCKKYPGEFFCKTRTTITTTTKVLPTKPLVTAAIPNQVIPITETETTTSGSSMGLIIGIVAALTVLCFVALVVILYCKKKKSGGSKGAGGGKGSASTSKASDSVSISMESGAKSASKSAVGGKSKMSKMDKKASKMDKKESKMVKKGKKKTKQSELKKMPGTDGVKSQMVNSDEKSDLRSKNLYSRM